MPNPERSHLIILPSTSGRRAESLRQLRHNIELQQLPGPAQELEDSDLSLVAQDKSHFAATLLQEVIGAMQNQQISNQEKNAFLAENVNLLTIALSILNHGNSFQIIGGDTQTSIAESRNAANSNQVELVSYGKPKDDAEVQKHFHDMNQIDAHLYQVFSGSHIASYTPEYELPIETRHTQKITVHLRPEMVKFFSSDQGFAHYQQAFADFYRSEAYSQNHLAPIQPTNISSGFSLPVFIKEKAVEAIELNGRKVNLSEANQEFLRQVIYVVAVGYSPVVLNQIFPDAYNFTIDNWSWLQEVVKEIAPHAQK